MTTDVVTPQMGESVTEGQIANWLYAQGDVVQSGDILAEIETDKVTMEIPAPVSGTLTEILAEVGTDVEVGAVIARITEGEHIAADSDCTTEDAAREPTPTTLDTLSPAVRRLVEEHALNPEQIVGTGKDGRLTKGDVLKFIDAEKAPALASRQTTPTHQVGEAVQPVQMATHTTPAPTGPREERKPMSKLRQRIAERLKEAQNTAAMLTTFNEVDMSAILALRKQYKESFEHRHGVKLGFMSFFVKAAIAALQEIPAVNAEIDGTDIIYKNHYDIGVAVGTDRGLVVPVVRNADRMAFHEVEHTIAAYGRKARKGQLTLDEMNGGTFTISNGGVYGSLLSTPILNRPQSAILGMHKTQDRPIAVNGEVVIRPMMYLALSYDHRIIDGQEAVTFLIRIKDALEDPQRLLLGL